MAGFVRTLAGSGGQAAVGGLHHDAEMLMVSSLLHDLGMTDRHREHTPGCQCFAGQGAFAALEAMRRFGWPEARAERLADAIALHMNGHVPLSPGGGDVEAHLLQQATALDVVGSRLHELAPAFRAEVFQRHPRLGFSREFAEFIVAEKYRYPQSRAALLCQLGLPLMIKFNPYQD